MTASVLFTGGPGPAPRSRRLLRLAFIVLVMLVTVVVVIVAAARPTSVPPPLFSRQVTGVPPLQAVVQDQGSTVALPDGRTLWIFADTAQLHTSPTFFVTSSAGIADGTDLRLRYLVNGKGVPIEFLPRTPTERADQVQGQHYTAIWPTGSTMLPDGRILIAYAKYAVRFVPHVAFDFLAGGLFTYRYPGWATLIGDPSATNGSGGSGGWEGSGTSDGGNQPAQRLADDMWTPQDGPIASPVYADGYVYFTRCEQFRCYSVRSSVAGLADRTAYQWWTGSGWNPDRAQAARISFGSDVPGRNPSIAWSTALKLFVMADTTGGIQSTSGRLWVARHPWGPWSRAAPFPLPGCPTGGCYTLNVHPDRSPPDTIRVSFATSGIGPYVRVVDVPVKLGPPGRSGRSGHDDAVPQIRTHGGGGNCGPITLTQCPNP